MSLFPTSALLAAGGAESLRSGRPADLVRKTRRIPTPGSSGREAGATLGPVVYGDYDVR